MIVILTALPVEQQAVLEHLVDVEVHPHRAGTLFDVGSPAGRSATRVALGVTGPGTLGAAALTERAITEFSPRAVMFVGVAGGLRSWLEIGDVVVGTKIHAYHGGRSEDHAFLVRPRSWDASHELEQVARRLPRSDAWYGGLAGPGEGVAPSVHFEPIAAGDVVLNSGTSPVATRIRENFNDAVAIEMESSGFAIAGHLSGSVPMVTIRSISDHADGTKELTDGRGSQRIAARNAAAFAVALAAAIDEAAGARNDQQSEAEPGNADAGGEAVRVSNVAQGNARVGQQFGVNHGGVTLTWGADSR
ncbi:MULTISPECIES: 5'-methylthioadenosine/S-adenosylhomocysteine nucleosidase [Actinoalloteichus]|uniref:Nucleoside phosphorylase n=1 Tax=Actinoalloteichus fjordicus TaxID=1612552 RepID=A0AAC9PST0_9PSEU|nr:MULTISPECIES: 5'-methylthioadenosine/S-adenosylhomocysteine nucleosidase [Actinoalloteichus]APU15443.1 nucleoside phosphorylase [Actinoalloteichus fjordicus]APU21511.1 nucleoside phosphorylase [Actinoalloteichus sp. GBA129-24]